MNEAGVARPTKSLCRFRSDSKVSDSQAEGIIWWSIMPVMTRVFVNHSLAALAHNFSAPSNDPKFLKALGNKAFSWPSLLPFPSYPCSWCCTFDALVGFLAGVSQFSLKFRQSKFISRQRERRTSRHNFPPISTLFHVASSSKWLIITKTNFLSISPASRRKSFAVTGGNLVIFHLFLIKNKTWIDPWKIQMQISELS